MKVNLKDRAIQCALNFAGQKISSADGTYDLLIACVMDAMEDYAGAIAEDLRAQFAICAREKTQNESDN